MEASTSVVSMIKNVHIFTFISISAGWTTLYRSQVAVARVRVRQKEKKILSEDARVKRRTWCAQTTANVVLKKRLVKIGYVPNSKYSSKYANYGSFMSFFTLHTITHYTGECTRTRSTSSKAGKIQTRILRLNTAWNQQSGNWRSAERQRKQWCKGLYISTARLKT